jgi:hypothetical protein
MEQLNFGEKLSCMCVNIEKIKSSSLFSMDLGISLLRNEAKT